MRLDSANRSFLALSAIGLLLSAFVICGAIGAVLEPLVLARLSHHGLVGSLSVSLLPVLGFLVLVAAGLVRAGRSLARQMSASRRLRRLLAELRIDSPDELTRMAGEAGLGGRVALLDAPEAFSFVHGALTPRVAVSLGLLERLSVAEVRAVLEHERYHVSNLDPLKILVARSLSEAFFLLPIFESLAIRCAATRELAADRHAVAACGSTVLARALLQVVHGPDWEELELAAPIGDPALLSIRVAQLERGSQPRLANPGISGGISLLGAGLLAAVFLASVSSLGGPAAIHDAIGAGLASAVLLGGLSCTAPFAGAALLVYLLIAVRANRSLEVTDPHGRRRPVVGA